MEYNEENFKKLQDDLTAANGESATRRKALSAANEKLLALDGIDPAAYKSAMGAQKELDEERLKKAGEFDKLLESKTSELQKIILQKDEHISSITGLREKEQIDGSLISALAANNAHAPDELSVLLRGQIGLDEHGPYVKDADGSPKVVEGQRLTVGAHVSGWLSERPQYVKAGAAGSGAQGGKGKQGTNVMPRAQFDALGQAERASFIKGGGRPV